MEPVNNGIGGDLFAIVYESKTGKLYGLNASGWASKAETPEMLRAKGITKMPESGAWTVTVPGAVAGWAALQQRFGTKPLSELLSPAIYYAENGVPINEVTAEDSHDFEKALSEHPLSKETFLVNGERAPRFGEAWKNPDLARSLRRIAGNGADGFYKGSTAQAIVTRFTSSAA